MDSTHQEILFYTIVRWLSRDDIITRVFDIFYELQVFLAAQGTKTEQLLKNIREPFKCSFAYLVDEFEALNGLNR